MKALLGLQLLMHQHELCMGKQKGFTVWINEEARVGIAFRLHRGRFEELPCNGPGSSTIHTESGDKI